MKYYKVYPKYDGMNVLKWSDKRHCLRIDNTLIANELYTSAELKKLLNGATLEGCGPCDQVFLPVEVKKTETYTSFGARFICGENHNTK